MLDFQSYKTMVHEVLGRDLDGNPAQLEGVQHNNADILMMVAGPGSGKTTVLVLRALRHVFVDDVFPEQILITTFTRKAAKELRTRWLDWGTALLQRLNTDPTYTQYCSRIDLNRCRIDTLDSISQQALTEHRLPGEMAPTVVEESASRILMRRASFHDIYSGHRADLDQFLSRYTFAGENPSTRGEALSVTKTLCDRLIHDRVDLNSYAVSTPEQRLICDILEGYQVRLRSSNIFDFASLELRFLERLTDGSLVDWTNNLDCILIDEYQDTNPLQEAIYFAIFNASSPRITIVGDDDQAMYRFRGGSVELFTQFPTRCLNQTGRVTRRIDMVSNFRSSEEIVSFYNRHVLGDPAFGPARIAPSKPQVVARRGALEVPVLGMFRASAETLANDLASWLDDLIINQHVIIESDEGDHEITISEEGDFGDFVLLAHSVEEVKFNSYDGVAETRFVGHLRHALLQRERHLFNPRGRSLRIIPNVQILLGLILHCLDPDSIRTEAVFPTNEARYFFGRWRQAASTFIQSFPQPNANGGLQGFVSSWQHASRENDRPPFPDDWPVLELVFKLISWMPEFQNDPEHQVWLEAVTRTIATAGMASPYGMQIYRRVPHADRSRESILRDALLPIAENEVAVDEDIMPSVPRHYLQSMTIHQAKGLEFPLVIVDVGSQFTRRHPKQAFLRFPSQPSNVVIVEDDVEPYLQSPLRGGRSPLERAFDDLVRLYYVAYSRPQSILMLVGCENCLKYGSGTNLQTGAIPNVALGWRRDETWPWRQPYSGRRAPIRVEPPLTLI